MGLGTSPEVLDSAVSPRGYRLVARVPRLPETILDRVVEHFGSLQKLLAASVEDLQAVEGIGETRARGGAGSDLPAGRRVDHRALPVTAGVLAQRIAKVVVAPSTPPNRACNV